PGIIVDRVNVGGAESGQQSGYQAKGAGGGENTWNMDGVAITDMAALGSTPTYYDFDMFQEFQVTTGGADLKAATPGVQLNMVLKSGSNTPHGSSRIYFENESMQANNVPDDLKATLGGTSGKGNRIDQYKDYGFEIGGPVWKNRAWAWGAIGKTDVKLLTLNGAHDNTFLTNYSFKGTGQVSNGIRGNFTFFEGKKEKFGRSAGPLRPQETTVDQGGPTKVYKGEGTFVLGSNLFLSANVSHVDGGFFLTPEGGLDVNLYRDDADVYHNSYSRYDTVRPQYSASLDGNFFRGRHEIKFGFGWRKADVDSTSTVPGNGIWTRHNGYPNMDAEVTAWNHTTSTTGRYTNFYVGDTWSADRLTLTAGLRWDRSAASVNELNQEGNPLGFGLLPDITGAAADDVLVFNSVTPRIGLTYALGESHKTLARASYAIFASQMNATAGSFMSVVGYRGVYFYNVQDLNGNQFVDAEEIAGRTCNDALANAGECSWYGFNIDNPGNVAAPIHKVGDYKTPLTHEVQLGMDHELMPNFGVSGTFTYRRFTNFNWRNNGLRASDYEVIDTATGSLAPVGNFSVPVYGVIPSHMPEDRAATTYESRPDYYQRYMGFELSAVKRMSNRWMARFGFSTNDHNQYFKSPAGDTDPTPDPSDSHISGGDVIRQSGGSGKSGIYQVLPKYQFSLQGMYQAPAGIDLGINMVTRQGFSEPYYLGSQAVADPNDSRKNILITSTPTDFRLPAVTSLDARVGKVFNFGRARVNFDLDIFNVLNSSTVLGRQYNLASGAANDRVLEIMNPRVLRVGLRFNF
ncbi:MAG TPA: hypothetical protein VF159_07740, partial [Gemmatimonadaceae bacterium]